MDELIAEQVKLQVEGGYGKAIDEVDKTLALLQAARDAIAADPNSAAVELAKLQAPVQQSFEGMNNCLRKVQKAQSGWNKALNKKFDPKKMPALPESDPLAMQSFLLDRAIAMHMLREGQFGVAATFIEETTQRRATGPLRYQESDILGNKLPMAPEDVPPGGPWDDDFVPPGVSWPEYDNTWNPNNPGEDLQARFAEMYHILNELRANRNLGPAISWARSHAHILESRGSNLEFELCRLQFVMLFTDPIAGEEMELDGSTAFLGDNVGDNDLQARTIRASEYARDAFPHFGPRYTREIQQLSCGLLYGANFSSSPYASLFANASAWEDVANSFTKEFCSLLGLSADSPLFVASTAGTIALPRIRKYAELQARNKVEWTSVGELPVEIPLPPSYFFHPIFVCPVSREQATDANPPMMMPCGHVILQESLANTSKGARFKCPYCPGESHPREARRVFLA